MSLLAGRVAFVTGAGGGVGSAVARLCAAEGAAVAVVDVDLAAAQRVAAEVAAAGGHAQAFGLDVRRPDQVRAVVAAAASALNGLDILVNNAGICPMSSLEETSVDEWERVIAVNLSGPFYCSQAAIPFLKRGGHGRIINISSLAGRIGGIAVGAHYSASKAGLLGLTKSLAKNLARYGITVNAIAPGTLDSGVTTDWPTETREGLRKQVPLGRLGTVDDVAAAVLYLASDAASFVTGATLDVNGGLAMV